jgi:hypothetical protein
MVVVVLVATAITSMVFGTIGPFLVGVILLMLLAPPPAKSSR